MKKVLYLILCLALSLFVLVGCDDGEIGDIPEHYPEVEGEIEDVAINMYIIVDDATSLNAIETVSRIIAQYTLTTYHTEVNVKYVKASEYETTVLAAVNATDATAANLVLVNSVEIMNKLNATGKLADLAPYLATDAFGTLNVTIPETLLGAAYTAEALYALPNNHVIGEYEYLVINENVAKQILKVSPTTLKSYTSYESTEELRALMESEGYDSTKYVTVQKGGYALKAELEASGNVCNVISLPKATAAEAFSSAFAVVNRSELLNERSMQIIYALNNDKALRDYLQYGVNGTNYTLNTDGEIVMSESADNTYRMNIEYTGNVFLASYCDAIDWTAEAAANGEIQNSQAVLNK